MLKRILIIAFFTGSGQLLSVFVLKFIAGHSTISQLKAIAEIDSLVFFIVNVIALGLQAAAMRNLVQAADWKQEYHDTQTARTTLGILMIAGAALAFINQYYLLFLIAPILAWSGDYALYARGYPITGSMIAFIRLAFPFAALLIAAVYFPGDLGWVYVVSLTVIYVITNIYITNFLKTGYQARFSFKKLQLYITTLPLGIIALALYFLGLGLILVAPYFFNTEVVTIAFIGLKFYVIFKGAQRIIHQAFIKEMMQYEVCFKVDQICGLMGLTFACFVICFPATFTSLFFGEKYVSEKLYFILLSVAGLVNSMFCSLVTKAVLEKKDRPYSIIASVSALLTVVLCIIFSTFWHDAAAIGSALLIGETVLVACTLWILRRPGLLQERMLFLIKNLPLVLIPLAMRYFIGDSMNPFIISGIIFGGVLALIHYRKFSAGFNDLTEA